MEYLILIPCIMVSVLITINRFKADNMTLDLRSEGYGIFIIGVIAPIMEESFFRGVLKQLFEDYDYNMALNVVCYSAIHSFNYLFTKDVKGTVGQVFLTMVLGYVCFNQPTILHAMAVHIFYNLMIYTLSVFIYNKFVYKTHPRMRDEKSLFIQTRRVSRNKYAMDDFYPLQSKFVIKKSWYYNKSFTVFYKHITTNMIHRIDVLRRI